MKKEKILKMLIYLTGIICFYAFISVRFLPLLNSVLKEKLSYWDNTKYGELYYFSMISHFREKGIPPFNRKFENSSKQSSIKDCQILTFGDSFFEFSRIKQFPEHLADDFNLKVHYANSDKPLEYIQKNNYHGDSPKLVIFERVERFIPITFQFPHTIPEVKQPEVSRSARIYDYVINKIFYKKSEEFYDLLLKRSFLTTGFYSLISTAKFNLFRYITDKTPVYKVDGDKSWLFYHDQVNGKRTSFYYPFSQQQIDSICDNMAELAARLKNYYNMDLVYLPLPARYTLYHHVVNNDTYNNFLPRLYKGLDERGIRYIKVFDEYKNNTELLFYRTDEHWNEKGFSISYLKTTNYIKNDSALSYYLNDTVPVFLSQHHSGGESVH